MKDISLYEKVGNLDHNFTVKFRNYEHDEPLRPHWHEHLEIVYVTSGACIATCEGKSAHLGAGDMFIANSTEIHSFINEGCVKFHSMLVYPDFFNDINFENINIQNFIFHDKHISKLMENLNKEYLEQNICFDMMLKSYTYDLFAYLTRNYLDKKITEKDIEVRKANLKRLEIVLKYISENYSEKITTSELSKMCFISESHFCRFFKSKIGQTATDYINNIRIEKATILLKSTEESVATIASNVGFEDLNYFSRIFKKIKGVSASTYRKGINLNF